MAKNITIISAITLLGLAFLGQPAQAQDSSNKALIDELVKSGVITSAQGQKIQQNLEQQQTSVGGDFLQVGSPAVKKLRIYGDVRLRYQWDDAMTPRYAGQKGNYGPDNDKNRYRYRVRVGADYQFADNWKSGIRLETSPKSNTASIDFGGFGSKDNAGVYFGLAYLEYENAQPVFFGSNFADYVDFRLGKYISPFMMPPAYWSVDFNPTGLSQQIGWKDVLTDGLGVTLRAAENLTSNVNEVPSVTNIAPGTDQWLLMGQAEFRYRLDQTTTFTVAPTFMYETNGLARKDQQDGGANFDGGVNPVNSDGLIVLGHITMFQIPVEFAWRAFDLPHRVFADYGINFSADERAKAFGMTHGSGNQMFNVGYQVGDTAKKGHWMLNAEYRYTESMAYDPYLMDTTFALGYPNQHGVMVNLGYAFSDNVWGILSLAYSDPIRGDSATAVRGINADAAGNRIGSIKVVQIDLNWKF